jgi:hypothetical protein
MLFARQHRPTFMFWVLFSIQIATAAVVLWNGVPFYRKLLLSQQGSDPGLYTTAVICTVIGLLAYWGIVPLRDNVKLRANQIAGHLIQFVGRLVFTFAGGMFSVVFYVKFNDLDIQVWKLILLMGILFSLFCFTTQIEWLGRKLTEVKQD